MKVHAYSGSDVGRVREGNEDNLFSGTTVHAVADGMGGHQAGEVASEMALQPIADLDGSQYRTPEEASRALAAAISAANDRVVAEAAANPSRRGMGTTLTAVMVRDGRLHVAHVGDSRCYLLREGAPKVKLLTDDHTLVEQLVREGRLSRDEIATHPQRSVITRAIGVDRDVDVDVLPPLELQPGDQVLLCSDGLTGPVDDEHITAILFEEADGEQAVRALLDAANAAGGPDNITVVLLRVDGGATRPVATAALTPADPEADTGETEAIPSGAVTPIRTREESGQDWASAMGRYGQPQGSHTRPPADPRQRSRRLLATVVGALVLLGLIVGGAVLLLSRAYFVGEVDGLVAIYRGVPQEVAGVSLHRRLETTDVAVADLPAFRAQRVRAGIPVESFGAAREQVELLRTAASEAAVAEPTPRPTDAPAGDPTATPAPFPTPAPSPAPTA